VSTIGPLIPKYVGRREESPYFVDGRAASFEFLSFAQPWSGSELRFLICFYCLFGELFRWNWEIVHHSFGNCYHFLDPVDWIDSFRNWAFWRFTGAVL
jgi:hypothetical protein